MIYKYCSHQPFMCMHRYELLNGVKVGGTLALSVKYNHSSPFVYNKTRAVCSTADPS
jgi:hypothetical protein